MFARSCCILSRRMAIISIIAFLFSNDNNQNTNLQNCPTVQHACYMLTQSTPLIHVK